MKYWTNDDAEKNIFEFNKLDSALKEALLSILNDQFPIENYIRQKEMLEKALMNQEADRAMLDGADQLFPVVIDEKDIASTPDDLNGYGIVLTAGGEGERLRLSLKGKGVSPEKLTHFTKATFPINGFPDDFGTLQINLCVISRLCRNFNIDIPVIVTTGPKGSTSAEIIPEIITKHQGFGLKNVSVVMQEERLHLTADKKIAYSIAEKNIRPVTNPDETGGPVMKLKMTMEDTNMTVFEWFSSLGCDKVILLQATALYDTELLLKMASAAKPYDGLGIGIPRTAFPEDDPYGTLVLVEKDNRKKIRIIEQATRNEETRKLQDENTGNYLPFNTGFYVFACDLLKNCDLPDYATPPKEVLPEIERAPKVGYAATDILSLANKPAILTISERSFGVIKNADDLETLSILGREFGLDTVCREIDLPKD